MSTQKHRSRAADEIADKIYAELPEDLAAAAHFSVNEKQELMLDFAVKLDKTDYPKILAIIKKYDGDFGNRKEDGIDVGFFFVPKPKPAATPAKPAAPSVSCRESAIRR